MCLMLMYLSNIFCLLCFVTFLYYFWCRWWFCYCFVIVLFTPILHFVNLIMVQFCYMANKIFCKGEFLSRINNKNTRLTQFIPLLRFIEKPVICLTLLICFLCSKLTLKAPKLHEVAFIWYLSFCWFFLLIAVSWCWSIFCFPVLYFNHVCALWELLAISCVEKLRK